MVVPFFRDVLAVSLVLLGMPIDEDLLSARATMPMVALVEEDMVVALMEVGVSWLEALY